MAEEFFIVCMGYPRRYGDNESFKVFKKVEEAKQYAKDIGNHGNKASVYKATQLFQAKLTPCELVEVR